MEHKIGDFVVRKWQGGLLWSMTGVITCIKQSGDTTFYSIRWNEDDAYSQRWRANEFEIIA